MQTRQDSQYDEFFGKYWLHDERVRTRGSISTGLWSKCSHAYDVWEGNFKGITWTLLVESALVDKLMLAITLCRRIESELEERNDISDDIDACTDNEVLCNDMHERETLPFIV